jgi:hypothetical protein
MIVKVNNSLYFETGGSLYSVETPSKDIPTNVRVAFETALKTIIF